jgi:hypothetical protein
MYVSLFKTTNIAKLDRGYVSTLATNKHLAYIDVQFVPHRKHIRLHCRKIVLVLFKEIIIIRKFIGSKFHTKKYVEFLRVTKIDECPLLEGFKLKTVTLSSNWA